MTHDAWRMARPRLQGLIRESCVMRYVNDLFLFLFQGYTPLHIAMQFGHEEIYNLLVQVYGKWRPLPRRFSPERGLSCCLGVYNYDTVFPLCLDLQ